MISTVPTFEDEKQSQSYKAVTRQYLNQYKDIPPETVIGIIDEELSVIFQTGNIRRTEHVYALAENLIRRRLNGYKDQIQG